MILIDGGILLWRENEEKPNNELRIANNEDNIENINNKGLIRKGDNVFELTFYKRESIDLIKKMYYSGQVRCLKRKKERCLKFLNDNLDFEPNKWQNRYT